MLESVLTASSSDGQGVRFWAEVADELYSNVHDLHDISDIACNLSSENEDNPAILVRFFFVVLSVLVLD
jgi:hypothetical protein